MSTIRETIETTYAATAFAERNLSQDACLVMKAERSQPTVRPAVTKRTEKPRPTLQAR